jgi:hypothetical protein
MALLFAKLPDKMETLFLKVTLTALLLGSLLQVTVYTVSLPNWLYRSVDSLASLGLGCAGGALICLVICRKTKKDS